MSLTLNEIPDHDQAPASAAPSRALSGLRITGARRTVLKAMALGAVTLGASALVWPRAARAETGKYGMHGWDRNDCKDAYPVGYEEKGDTSGAHVNTYGACFNGAWRGSNFCDGGWHKYGTWNDNGVQADHAPTSTACGTTTTKNAWKWTTPDGIVYRCSDGFTTFWGGGHTGQTYLTICRAVV
ncbi:hypothetical protein GCM10022247_40300 [Allokutzneria multivorans]|uniref:Uncharacterized protein n=1 Tax=Allokutzneria multivorans TaxID=1142134 RepID=A0ABP7SLQ1_9PSEU